MATRRDEEKKPKDLCIGGQSWARRKFEHERGKIKDVLCYRCGSRMGCSMCVEIGRELLCLICHNWATRTAVRFHGDIVPNPKVPRVRTDRGMKIYEQGNTTALDKITEIVGGLANAKAVK